MTASGQFLRVCVCVHGDWMELQSAIICDWLADWGWFMTLFFFRLLWAPNLISQWREAGKERWREQRMWGGRRRPPPGAPRDVYERAERSSDRLNKWRGPNEWTLSGLWQPHQSPHSRTSCSVQHLWLDFPAFHLFSITIYPALAVGGCESPWLLSEVDGVTTSQQQFIIGTSKEKHPSAATFTPADSPELVSLMSGEKENTHNAKKLCKGLGIKHTTFFPIRLHVKTPKQNHSAS